MENNKILFCAIALFISSVHSYSQSQSSYPSSSIDGKLTSESQIKSIESNNYENSLSEFNEIADVELYTGGLKAGLPLCVAQSRFLKLNVNLSYHSTGIKTSDISSSVGMGWSLIAGGSITRELRGLPDEYPTVGYLAIGENLPNFLDQTESNQQSVFSNIVSGNIDGQADVFYYNLPGASGKFIFDENQEILQIPETSNIITKLIIDDKIFSFTITTNDGLEYTFGNSELAIEQMKVKSATFPLRFRHDYNQYCSDELSSIDVILDDGTSVPIEEVDCEWEVVDYLNGNSVSLDKVGSTPGMAYDEVKEKGVSKGYFTSKWHLKEIKDLATLDYIQLVYNNQEELLDVKTPNVMLIEPRLTLHKGGGINESLFFSDVDDADPDEMPQYYDNLNPEENENPDPYSPNLDFVAWGHTAVASQVKVFNQHKQLSQIITATGETISFIYDAERQDLSNSTHKALSEVSVQNSIGEIVKVINFEYDNVISSSISSAPENPLYSSLFNVGIKYDNSIVSSYLGESTKDYYYNRLFLKKVFERSSDGTAVPSYEFNYYKPNGLPKRTSMYRDPFGYYASKGFGTNGNAKLGMLNEILYPSGGSSKIFFGLHKASNYDQYFGTKVDKIVHLDIVNSYPKVKFYKYTSGRLVSVDNSNYEPVYDMYENYHYYDGFNIKLTIHSSNNQNIPPLTKGGYVGYQQVEVYTGDYINKIGGYGREIFYYTGTSTYLDESTPIYLRPKEYYGNELQDFVYGRAPFPSNISNEFKRGILIRKSIKDESGFLLYDESYDLNIEENDHFVYGIVAAKQSDGKRYNGGYYYHKTGKLTQHSATIFDGVEKHFNYVYDSHMNIKRVYINENENEYYTIKYNYPYDIVSGDGSSVYDKMINNNIINIPIEEIYSHASDDSDEIVLHGEIKEFTYLNDQILFKNKYTLESKSPIIYDDYSSINFASGNLIMDGNYRLSLGYNSFSDYGQVTDIWKKGDKLSSRIYGNNSSNVIGELNGNIRGKLFYDSFEEENDDWQYSGTYSYSNIAKTGKKSLNCTNCSVTTSRTVNSGKYDLVFWAKDTSTPTISGVTIISSNSEYKNNQGWQKFYYKIQATNNAVTVNGITGRIDELCLYPSNSFLKTYSYYPKLGLESETDVNRLTTYYSYDEFGRLRIVKDDNKNIIKRVNYEFIKED